MGSTEAHLAKVADRWTMDCQPYFDAFMKGSLIFGTEGKNRVVSYRSYYADAQCTKELYQLNMVYDVKTDGPGTDTSFELQTSLVRAEMAVMSGDMASRFSSQRFCDKYDLSPGVLFDVTGLTCEGYTFTDRSHYRVKAIMNPDRTLRASVPGDDRYYDFHR